MPKDKHPEPVLRGGRLWPVLLGAAWCSQVGLVLTGEVVASEQVPLIRVTWAPTLKNPTLVQVAGKVWR